ncbi:hypothetical protein GCK72_025640 [Caenorhabditis remanei]|uniref:Uncharacterized protein n=1 Tax=Caenorhabditis remanei TaxID=31234 RepID=A0A6A5G2Z8_CAERE|nr:hypothetical protein GCK72_025640 [Caenorhabditis remanei]KAF1749173.1 hypothetical protein GCK72_025640 [Caenorhabditis remanei]
MPQFSDQVDKTPQHDRLLCKRLISYMSQAVWVRRPPRPTTPDRCNKKKNKKKKTTALRGQLTVNYGYGDILDELGTTEQEKNFILENVYNEKQKRETE